MPSHWPKELPRSAMNAVVVAITATIAHANRTATSVGEAADSRDLSLGQFSNEPTGREREGVGQHDRTEHAIERRDPADGNAPRCTNRFEVMRPDVGTR